MKKSSTWLAIFTVLTLVGACKKDETVVPAATGPSNTTLQGTWVIATAQGTEWKKGVGISTPKAATPDFIGLKLTIDGSSVTVKDATNAVIFGPQSMTFYDADDTILIGANGNTGLGLFKITNFVASATMSWDQREPIDADYSMNASCSCELYFQKFWTFTKVP